MMSVKHIAANGDETVLSCSSVEYLAQAATLKLREGDKQHMLTGGRAFVMNAAGATVARYNLEPATPR